MKTSIFGLGIIGTIWARHYHAAGCLAATWNRSPKVDAPLWQADIRAAARAGDLLQIVVADPAAVAGVLQAILPELSSRKIVVQSSTIDPVSSGRFRSLVEGCGARYVEAPFTGSKPAAEARKTIFFLGGDSEAVAAVEPVLAEISSSRFRLGNNEQATALKLAMNLNIGCVMQGLCESLSFARKAGISDDTYFEVLSQNVSYSGLAKLKEAKLRTADFAPQFSVKHLLKDLRLALNTGGESALPETALVRERLRMAEERGWADEDFSVLINLLQ
jgi:3-hydroxyisobutyrate dehydrogenase-like beta-hydroxyacid dehydrogenase